MTLKSSISDREMEKFAEDIDLGEVVKTLTKIYGSISGSFTPSGLSTAGLITHISLTDTTWTPLPVSALTGRNNLTVQNISGNSNVVLWNYSASAPATEGFRIEDGGHKSVAIKGTVPVYGRMLSGVGTVVVDEVA